MSAGYHIAIGKHGSMYVLAATVRSGKLTHLHLTNVEHAALRYPTETRASKVCDAISDAINTRAVVVRSAI